jgi:hypothetical protein
MAKTVGAQGTRVFLSPDKSKISVVKFTKKIMYTSDSLSGTFICFFDCDTVRQLFPKAKAKKYMNDSSAYYLYCSIFGAVSIEDSLVPRNTRLIGHDRYVKRQLEIVGDSVDLNCTGDFYKIAKNQDYFLITLIVSFVLFVLFLLYFYFSFESRGFYRILIIIFTIAAQFFFSQTDVSFFDSFFLTEILTLPIFSVTFMFQKREKIKKQKEELAWQGYGVIKPLFSFENGSKMLFNKHTNHVLFVDKNYRVSDFQPYDVITSFENGIAFIKKGILWGIINKEGKILTSPKYKKYPKRFMGGFIVIEDEEEKTVDENGNFYDPTNVC